jgi:single-stranded DNA-binding protein
MSEIRMNEVFAAGRISCDPVRTPNGLLHFLLDASESQTPFHCVCAGVTAANVEKYCQQGAEISIEGELRWMQFQDTGNALVIGLRFVSYGRKLRSLTQRVGD